VEKGVAGVSIRIDLTPPRWAAYGKEPMAQIIAKLIDGFSVAEIIMSRRSIAMFLFYPAGDVLSAQAVEDLKHRARAVVASVPAEHTTQAERDDWAYRK
jgi:hypothetical protein